MLSVFLFLLSSLGCVLTAHSIPSGGGVIDMIHHNFPKIEMPYISDILILTQTVTAVTVINRETLSEMFLIMAVVQCFRILCMASTVLPPLKNYHDKYRLGGVNGNGTEYIFSGHASYSALSSIYLYTLGKFGLLPLVFYNLISQSLIVFTHNHYTVDVVLAWIITPLVYSVFSLCKQVDTCVQKIEYVL